jgi:hypothetical protein
VGICACDAPKRTGANIDGAGQQGVMPRSRAAAMPSGLRRSFRTLMRRGDAEMHHPDAFLRRHAPCCAAHAVTKALEPDTSCNPRKQERQPTCAACPNLAARQPDRSASRHANFARIPADVIGFVSQFFFIDLGHPRRDEHARPPFLVRGRRQGWRAAIAASRQSARNPIPPRGVLQDNSYSPGERVLADRRYGPRAATRTGSCEVSIS